MIDETKKVDDVIETLDNALNKLKTVAQGRVFNVGTKVTYRGKFGVVTDLNQGSEDPAGSTIDLRLDDGTQVENVKVTSAALEFFRS